MSDPARKTDDEPVLEMEFSDVDDPEARELAVEFLVRLLSSEPQE